MKNIYVIDTCSLLDFFKFYQFDKHNDGTVYTPLRQFLVEKINKDEIIIIDKVFEEVKTWRDFDFKKQISGKIAPTTALIVKVKELSTKYYIEANEKFFKTQDAINQKINEHENTVADFFLIAKCLSLKAPDINPILVTEETKRFDNKLFEKLPTICNQERLTYTDIPHLLFETYKDELEFKLKITAK